MNVTAAAPTVVPERPQGVPVAPARDLDEPLRRQHLQDQGDPAVLVFPEPLGQPSQPSQPPRRRPSPRGHVRVAEDRPAGKALAPLEDESLVGMAPSKGPRPPPRGQASGPARTKRAAPQQAPRVGGPKSAARYSLSLSQRRLGPAQKVPTQQAAKQTAPPTEHEPLSLEDQKRQLMLMEFYRQKFEEPSAAQVAEVPGPRAMNNTTTEFEDHFPQRPSPWTTPSPDHWEGDTHCRSDADTAETESHSASDATEAQIKLPAIPLAISTDWKEEEAVETQRSPWRPWREQKAEATRVEVMEEAAQTQRRFFQPASPRAQDASWPPAAPIGCSSPLNHIPDKMRMDRSLKAVPCRPPPASSGGAAPSMPTPAMPGATVPGKAAANVAMGGRKWTPRSATGAPLSPLGVTPKGSPHRVRAPGVLGEVPTPRSAALAAKELCTLHSRLGIDGLLPSTPTPPPATDAADTGAQEVASRPPPCPAARLPSRKLTDLWAAPGKATGIGGIGALLGELDSLQRVDVEPPSKGEVARAMEEPSESVVGPHINCEIGCTMEKPPDRGNLEAILGNVGYLH
jgi:hypothetical protein